MNSPATRIGVLSAIRTRCVKMTSKTSLLSEGHHRAAVPIADLEPDAGHAALPTQEAPRFDSPVHIRVISYRKLNHDPDGVSVKAVLDGIVRAGILADDSAKQIAEITFESRKSKDERTVIEIEDT